MRDATGDLFEADSIVAHRYRIIRYRGDRGFGQVYEAHDSAMDRRVALMRLSREFSRPDTRESFYETRSTAAVEDPRIVDLCDYGEDVDGRLFLVMPWVEEAEALDELLAREGALAWPRARAIVAQIAAALEAAHQKGVLHGGLEPRRILIDRDDGVHIVDFGLAPALTQSGGREITMSGPLPGRIEYLSPEQVRGEAVDARSDIYALGVILWELIAGTPPFSGDSVAVADAHLGTALPELPRRGPNSTKHAGGWAPADVEPLLHLALAKDPTERLSSASEFSSLLTAMPGAEQPTLTRVPTRPLAPSVRKPAAKPIPKPIPKPAAKPIPKPIPKPAAKAIPKLPPSKIPEPPRTVAEPPPRTVAEPPPPTTPPPVSATVPEPPTAAPERPAAGPSVGFHPGDRPEPSVVAAGVPQPITARPEPEPPTPPARKRRLGTLELAILVFLGFDVLLFVGWKLFGNRGPTPDETVASAAASSDETPAEPAAPAKPAPEPEPEPEPDPTDSSPRLSVEEAIAAELPPEPDTPGPVRPMSKTLSDKALREAMVGARDSMLDECLDTRMRRTLKIALKIAASGKVEYARVVGNQADTALGQCIVKQVYKIEFPPTYEGSSHTYTLRLR